MVWLAASDGVDVPGSVVTDTYSELTVASGYVGLNCSETHYMTLKLIEKCTGWRELWFVSSKWCISYTSSWLSTTVVTVTWMQILLSLVVLLVVENSRTVCWGGGLGKESKFSMISLRCIHEVASYAWVTKIYQYVKRIIIMPLDIENNRDSCGQPNCLVYSVLFTLTSPPGSSNR